MKAERRHELHTNELSEQLDQISSYVKDNALTLIVVVTATALIVGGGVWYYNAQKAGIMEGWAMLDSASADSTAAAIDTYRSVAASRKSEGLTVAALLKTGDAALQAAMGVTDDPDAGASRDWPAIAGEAYETIINQHSSNVTACGKAMIGLGLLAENGGDMETARKWYQRILDSSTFETTPFAEQATYRLEGLDQWQDPIVFPPPSEVPSPPTPEPTPTGVPAEPGEVKIEKLDPDALPPELKKQIEGMSTAPTSGVKAEPAQAPDDEAMPDEADSQEPASQTPGGE